MVSPAGLTTGYGSGIPPECPRRDPALFAEASSYLSGALLPVLAWLQLPRDAMHYPKPSVARTSTATWAGHALTCAITAAFYFSRDIGAKPPEMATVKRSTFLRIVVAFIAVTPFAWGQ